MGDAELVGGGVGDAQLRATVCGDVARSSDHAGLLGGLSGDDDILAGGVYLAARDRSIRIPEELSVVGFDDLDFARVLAPPLTTVGVDAEHLGAAAFETLARDLAGETVAAEQVIPVTRCVRESTAPPA